MSVSTMFTPRQIEVLDLYKRNTDWRTMVLYGAKRSGKTFINNFLFLLELRRAAKLAKNEGVTKPKYILAGTSDKTITNNVISEVEDLFGMSFRSDQNRNLHVQFPGLPDMTIVKAPTGSIAGLKSIRGMTSYGAYINEASLANQMVFKEIRDRCSKANARVICDTNPDAPTHWLKTDIIDADSKTIVSVHFTLNDNATKLPKTYVADQKQTTPSGMFYDRDILGKWVSGDGLVYSDYDRQINSLTLADFNARFSKQEQASFDYVAGVDFGFEHKGVIVVIAIDHDGNHYLVDEYTHKHWQINRWLDVAHSIESRYGRIPFYCDSARPEYVQAFRDAGFNAANANKRIMAGVERVAGLIKSGRFKAIVDRLEYFEKELYEYIWDQKTGMPLKADGNDDVMDATRYAVYNYWLSIQARQKAGNVQTVRQKADILTQHGLL